MKTAPSANPSIAFTCRVSEKSDIGMRIFTIQLSLTGDFHTKAAIIRRADKRINRLRILTRFPTGSQLV